MAEPFIIILMGVSGSGKTTIGERLARELGWNFHDADTDHAPESIEQMARGEPLSEEQRTPWLRMLSRHIRTWCDERTHTVLACSALTERSRATLASPDVKEHVVFVHLRGDYDVIHQRMGDRAHFMPPLLLQSQFESLESPRDGFEVDAAEEPNAIVERIRTALKL